jgi:hypothetical protein
VSARVVRRVVAGCVAALMVWPLLHAVLAARLGFDPWELFGFAMYALPAQRVQVRVDRVFEGRPVLVGLRADSRMRVAEYKRWRQALGPRISPYSLDALAQDILALEPEMEEVEIRVLTWRLDRDSATLVVEEESHRFPRGQDSSFAPFASPGSKRVALKAPPFRHM